MTPNQLPDERRGSQRGGPALSSSTGAAVLKIILAVILGYAAIAILVITTDTIWAATVPGFRSMVTPPTRYFSASLATDSFYSVLGGWICAFVAGEHRRMALVGLLVVAELLGVAATIAFWSTVPHWFGLALLILYPAFVWMGSQIPKR